MFASNNSFGVASMPIEKLSQARLSKDRICGLSIVVGSKTCIDAIDSSDRLWKDYWKVRLRCTNLGVSLPGSPSDSLTFRRVNSSRF